MNPSTSVKCAKMELLLASLLFTCLPVPSLSAAAAPSSPTLGSTASRWRELQGKDLWKGLLDPLDMDLRRSIISYGELQMATYDGFNRDMFSPHAGACVYGPADLLRSVGVAAASSYSVTKFLYATSAQPGMVRPLPEIPNPWSRDSNWIGYVAVATDEGVAKLGRRDIVVAWRGTQTPQEWAKDLTVVPVSAAPVLGSAAAANRMAMVHQGFLSVYTSSNANSKYNKASARDQVCQEVRRLMDVYKNEVTSITVTGHSLGSALATLNAVDIVANGLNAPAGSSKPPCPVTALVFACPHVGNDAFKAAFNSFRDLRSLHVKNNGDLVAVSPPLPFVDVAVVLPIDTTRSPYLRFPPESTWTLHDPEGYLHGVAGVQGSAGGFKLVVNRDVALVNKYSNALKFEYGVPPYWWVVKNNGMVKGADGHWKLKDFEV